MKHKAITPFSILSVLNGIPHGIALMDKTMRLTGMNHFLEAITGHTSAQAAGAPVDSIIRTNLSHKNPLYREALANGGPAIAEGDLITGDRKKIPVRLTVTPFDNPANPDGGLLLFIEDLSFFKELEKQRQSGLELKGMIGHSPQLREVLDFIPVLAHTDATVLITGETGTGKDILAEAIHQASKRAPYPFIKVNCGALPESLLESELFGHARGAFTGAHADKPGMFRLAQGGTIFLTEIGDLPLPLQVKLLTVLDDRAFYPLGGSKKVQVDVRVITGTHRNLKELVEHGTFRQDLFFRLNVLNVHLPPLRQREGDIRLLVDHFLQQFSASLRKDIKGFNQAALRQLTGYAYPGNVRELRNIVEYASSVCKAGLIGPEHLPEYISRPQANQAGQPPASPSPAQQNIIETAPEPAAAMATESPATEKSWREAEKKLILEALIKHKGNRGATAKALGWGRSTLWRKIKQHKID